MLAIDPTVTAIPDDVIWIDLSSPSAEEDIYIEGLLKLELPRSDDLTDLEPSSRLYKEDNNVFMIASILHTTERAKPALHDVAFILTPRLLVTIRYEEDVNFLAFMREFKTISPEQRESRSLLLNILDAISDRSAEVLENTVAHVDQISSDVFSRDLRGKRKPAEFLESKVAELVFSHRLVSKLRDSMTSLTRLLSYLNHTQSLPNDNDMREFWSAIVHDLQTLSEHASFISGNLNFLLDAVLGVINVEQNAITKLFSIVAVIFMPPTLLASIYGMNFKNMPELEWQYSYPLVLTIMLIVSLGPFLFFRWKRWL